MKSVKEKMRRILAGVGIHVRRGPQRGIDPTIDLKRATADFPVRTVFDVGANVGQSTLAYADRFHGARIWCFEPFEKTREILQKNTSFISERVVLCSEALCDKVGTAQFAITAQSDMNHIVQEGTDKGLNIQSELVQTSTIDAFCRSNNIRQIDFLKIDTEGSDLAVIKGASEILREQRIRFVQVEAGMNVRNSTHVPFLDLVANMREFHYDLFGVYEQFAEGLPNDLFLRRADLMFTIAHH